MKRTYSAYKVRAIKVPGSTVAVLTVTSKIPGPSFSLPAHKACPNANGSVCDNCYASKGCYFYPGVKQAQEVRFKWTVASMRDTSSQQVWINHMITAISHSEARYFRGHDSGDFFNVQYVRAWIAVCRALPNVRFWFPTREWQVKNTGPFTVMVENPRLVALRELASLPNVTIRPSALNVGDTAPKVIGLHAGSTVNNAAAFQCRAYARDEMCGHCRVCWTKRDTPVSYPLH